MTFSNCSGAVADPASGVRVSVVEDFRGRQARTLRELRGLDHAFLEADQVFIPVAPALPQRRAVTDGDGQMPPEGGGTKALVNVLVLELDGRHRVPGTHHGRIDGRLAVGEMMLEAEGV